MEIKEPDTAYGGLYTYADYLKWDLKERVELLKGRIFKMSPAPNTMHQKISIRISSAIFNDALPYSLLSLFSTIPLYCLAAS